MLSRRRGLRLVAPPPDDDDAAGEDDGPPGFVIDMPASPHRQRIIVEQRGRGELIAPSEGLRLDFGGPTVLLLRLFDVT